MIARNKRNDLQMQKWNERKLKVFLMRVLEKRLWLHVLEMIAHLFRTIQYLWSGERLST